MHTEPTKRSRLSGDDSPMPQDVIVAIIDVLGFKQIVQERPLEQVNEEYRALLRLKLQSSSIPDLSLNGVDIWKSPSAVFSDTIMFWAHADPESIESFLSTCSVLVAGALQMRWPLRGGIAAGQCVMDRHKRVFVGQPIIDAYLLEQAQEWVGVALHPSCLVHPNIGSMVPKSHNVCGYKVPTKPKYSSEIKYALEWASRIIDSVECLEELRESGPKDQRHKYDNAINFVRATRPD